MAGTYEQVFLALAMRNKMLTHEAAQDCLAEFRRHSDGSVEEILRSRGLLSDAQILQLQAGARKVMLGTPTMKILRPVAPADPIPGYRISGKIGSGGTSTVFLAEDVEKGGRSVALKILHPSLAKDAKAVDRFCRESRLLVEFDHPNLVKGFAEGRAGPLAWLAMEYLDGESAQAVLDREKRTGEARALEIILDSAKALEYLQSKGIVHRDIKPGNILLLTGGGIKVCDLGFAQPISESGGEGEEETTSGTAQYMSPEQARGLRDIDIRADIYSLGATLYHLVMGELPFGGVDSLDVMAKQVMEALNSSEIKNRRISRHMHYFIERMMSKDKTLRYSNPRELIDDIHEQIEGFKSLEFDADRARQDSSILRRMKPGEATGEEVPKPTTRRFRKIDEITKRFRRDR